MWVSHLDSVRDPMLLRVQRAETAHRQRLRAARWPFRLRLAEARHPKSRLAEVWGYNKRTIRSVVFTLQGNRSSSAVPPKSSSPSIADRRRGALALPATTTLYNSRLYLYYGKLLYTQEQVAQRRTEGWNAVCSTRQAIPTAYSYRSHQRTRCLPVRSLDQSFSWRTNPSLSPAISTWALSMSAGFVMMISLKGDDFGQMSSGFKRFEAGTGGTTADHGGPRTPPGRRGTMGDRRSRPEPSEPAETLESALMG